MRILRNYTVVLLPSYKCYPLKGDRLLVTTWVIVPLVKHPSITGSSYKYPAGQSHVLRGTTPHCDMKTLPLGTRFHQHKEDNSRLGQTVVLFSESSLEWPEQVPLLKSSRCDWVV